MENEHPEFEIKTNDASELTIVSDPPAVTGDQAAPAPTRKGVKNAD